MRNRPFMLYLSAIFIFTIILIVFLQYNSNRHINKLIHGNESLITEFQILVETQKLQTDMLYIESEIHRAVIGEDSSYLEAIYNREKNARMELQKLDHLILNDTNKTLIEHLDSLIMEKLKFGNNVLDALFTKGQPAAEQMYKSRKGKNAMGKIIDDLELMNSDRRHYLTQLAIDADTSGHRAKEWGIIFVISAVLGCIFTFGYIIKRIIRQQQLFDKINESEKKVREAGIMKENFMANMSHEIRTPMNAILGFTNLLHKEPLNNKSREFVNSIQNSGENLLTIINDILDFSKIEAGMMRIESNPFSLRGLLHSLETMFIVKAHAKDLHLAVDIDDSLPDVLKGDAVRLTQILVNLVNNSMKFTHSGEIHISVTGKQSGGSILVSFSVKDTGIGIPADKINSIFERFQQADEDTTRKYGGTGLGLSIVKQLVDLQNGTIIVKSIQNKGTEFVFTVPYSITEEVIKYNKLKYISSGKIQLDDNVTILVAEDNVMNQNLMEHLLTEWNLYFDIVNNGKETIEALKKKKYSLVLMDIQMPLMDGYTATQKIRNELHDNVPIIAMTAHAMAGEREKCLSYGMNEYISKPIRENELFKIINELLRRRSSLAEKMNDHENSSSEYTSVLNLKYLHELSGGNTEFEVNMIEQFLQQAPAELASISIEFSKKNYTAVAQIAHNMITTVSFMGLTEIAGPHLDYIQNNAVIEKENAFIEGKIRLVNKICLQAIEEARQYLQHLRQTS